MRGYFCNIRLSPCKDDNEVLRKSDRKDYLNSRLVSVRVHSKFISSSVSPISPSTQTDCTAISSGQYASL